MGCGDEMNCSTIVEGIRSVGTQEIGDIRGLNSFAKMISQDFFLSNGCNKVVYLDSFGIWSGEMTTLCFKSDLNFFQRFISIDYYIIIIITILYSVTNGNYIV